MVLALNGERPQLTADEVQKWRRIEPSVVYLLDGGAIKGAAALIDQKGYFIAHRSIVTQSALQGRLPDGRTIRLRLIAADEATQLVLLAADLWLGGPKPVALSSSEHTGDKLFAVLPNGPICASVSACDKLGVINPSRRVLSLCEIRFEDPSQVVGGALVFTQNGEFVGALSATLKSDDVRETTIQKALGGGGGAEIPSIAKRLSSNRVGPAELTVGYTAGADALRRVIEGFRSPTHQVAHPALGIFCRDANGDGALVDRISPESPAFASGLMPGDEIYEMAGIRITNQVDYARVLLRQAVGARIEIKYRRGGTPQRVSLTVGK